MTQLKPYETSDEVDIDDAPMLTADDLGLITPAPMPENLLAEIEDHLRELSLCSGK